MKLVQKGAEADIYQIKWQSHNAIMKIRNPKVYRNLQLDSRIRRQRTIKESQMICKVKSFGVPTPLIYFVNLKKSLIIMQQIPGKTIHDLANPKIIQASKEIGRLVGIMHKNSVMHGDLTTSNFIMHNGTIFVIDFGLSQYTTKFEDYAVDLRLIKEILNSAHAEIIIPAWKRFLIGYRSIVGNVSYAKIITLVTDIEKRGRYATVT